MNLPVGYEAVLSAQLVGRWAALQYRSCWLGTYGVSAVCPSASIAEDTQTGFQFFAANRTASDWFSSAAGGLSGCLPTLKGRKGKRRWYGYLL